MHNIHNCVYLCDYMKPPPPPNYRGGQAGTRMSKYLRVSPETDVWIRELRFKLRD